MSTEADKPPARAHQLEVLQSITELMDTLPTPEAKREVLAFLAASQGVTIKDPPAPRTGRGYGYSYKRRG
jgi:hypothetical protein